jgi:hypothetical protein
MSLCHDVITTDHTGGTHSINWVDECANADENSAMARYRRQVYAVAKTPRFCVLFSLQWNVIESQQLEPATDLTVAMQAAIERHARGGWQAESSHEFGFVFLGRDGERRLLILTERDPYDTRPQSFSPFGTGR